jgi:tRNA pseudouridine38-40 synthase
MYKIALKVSYLGKDYYGFQRQPGLPTIEGELLKAFKEADIFDNVIGAGYSIAGRTDRGVNALGNVVTFHTEKEVQINRLNDILPRSIRILGQASVHLGFLPRYAKERHYRYIVPKTPFEEPLETGLMEKGSEIFRGTHDFRNFSKRSERNPIRTINTLEINECKNYFMFDVKGESFLWNMVRKLITVLLNIGREEIEIEEAREYLNPDKQAFITPMPPEGLILMDIKYDKVKFTDSSYARKNMVSFLKQNYQSHITFSAAYEEMIKSLDELDL